MYHKDRMKNGLLLSFIKRTTTSTDSTLSRKTKKINYSCDHKNNDDAAIKSTVTTETVPMENCGNFHGLCFDQSCARSSISTMTRVDDYDTSCHSSHSYRLDHTAEIASPPKKEVRFDDNKTQWYTVECYVQYASDLWYSNHEVKQLRFDMANNILNDYTPDELHHILHYSDTYYMARQKSTVSNTHHQHFPAPIAHNYGTSIAAPSKSKITVSWDEYKIIVHGKSKGWTGFERMLGSPRIINNNSPADNILPASSLSLLHDDHDGWMTVHEIVQTIVTSYQTIIASSYDTSHTTNQYATYDTVAQKLRSLSKSLTAGDRSWAVVMANADRDASHLS
jgi:hypothetical protein